MKKKLRIICVGAGKSAIKWTSIMQQDSGWELVALVDIDEKALARVGRILGLGSNSLFTSPPSAFKKMSADAVLIATTPDAHKQITLQPLEAGLHVLCEKPLAANIQEAKQLKEEIAHYRQKFMVSQNYRGQTEIATIKQVIEQGSIGKIGYINWVFNKSFHFGDWREKLEEILIRDMSIHHFDLMRYLTGKNCVRLYARSFNPSWSWFQSKPSASVIMEFEEAYI